jgi:uncharacterized protein (DUF952 family)
VRIYHVTSDADWRAALPTGHYRWSTRGRSLDDVGFIHCSYAEQVTRVANAIYLGVHGLVLLVIDPSRLTSPVRDEAPDKSEETFPHIYGPLNTHAVVEVRPFEPSHDGSFELP